MPKQALFEVQVGGQDVSSRWRPILISLSVVLTASSEGNSLSMELDDRESQIEFPEIGDEVSLLLGWEGGDVSLVFEGTIDEVRSKGARNAGQLMFVNARGVDVTSHVKDQFEKHTDTEDLKGAATELSKESDIDEVTVDQGLQNIKRKWWALQNESFIHWGARVAKEIGANFQVNGKTASFTKLLGGTSATGKALLPVAATMGENLHEWDMSPILGRPIFSKTRARWFDIEEPKWKEKTAETDLDGSETQFTSRPTQFREEEAEAQANHDSDDSEKNSGEGTVVIEGDPMAQPGAQCTLSGIRPGIDGSYLIDSVRHSVSRMSGFITTLELKHPDTQSAQSSSGTGQGQAVPTPPVRPEGLGGGPTIPTPPIRPGGI